jgi:addiction module HigA family antidote
MRSTIRQDIHSPGHILSKEFIKPSGKSYRSIERKYNIRYPPLIDIVRGRRRITPILARQFQSAFVASTRYWLDIQTYYELTQMHGGKLIHDKSIGRSLIEFRSIVEFSEPEVHPGKFLFNKFLKTSELSISDWNKILFVTFNELDSILSGKKVLSTALLIKLSRIFNTDISYWIDLNNKYISQLANERYLEYFGKEGEVVD